MTHPNSVRVLQTLVHKSRGPHGGLSGRLEAKGGFVELVAISAPQYLVIKK